MLFEHKDLILYLRQRRYTKRTLGEGRNKPKGESIMDTLRNLQLVTRALALAPESRDVDVFGSTAQQLREFVANNVNIFETSPDADNFVFDGNDFDLVVTVSPRIYDAWNQELTEHLNCVADCDAPSADAYDGCKWFRFNLALKLLGVGTYKSLEPLYGWLYTLDEITELDIHLMPEDWRSRTVELQDHLPHHDPLFVSNIAHDAVRLTEVDTTDVAIWQTELFRRVARLQYVRTAIGNAAVFSATISHGLTRASQTPLG